ncbi:MAG: helix-turn-helix domain-containing protein [Nitrosomonas sp.]|nr:helix-turn-helix domain-containing protein [Nitrosomonas sp.]
MYNLLTPHAFQVSQLDCPITKNVKKFAIMGTMLFGTGSAYSMDDTEKWRNHLQPRVAFVLDNNKVSTVSSPQVDTRTPTEHIENIRSVLDPSISDLANLLNISRQAVYKWLSGSSMPEAEKQGQIATLSHIADKFKAADISRADSMLKMKAFNGLSLLDLLKSGEDCSKQVDILIAEAKAMEESYNKSGIALSKTKPTNDWKSSVSIPGSPEEI